MTTQTSTTAAKKSKTKVFTLAVSADSFSTETEMVDYFMVIEAACDLGFKVLMLEAQDRKAQNFSRLLLDKFPNSFEIAENNEVSKRQIKFNADCILLSKKPTREELIELQLKELIPICPQTDGLFTFSAQNESGNAIIYGKNNVWHILQSLIIAHENFKFTYDWRNLYKNFMDTKF